MFSGGCYGLSKPVIDHTQLSVSFTANSRALEVQEGSFPVDVLCFSNAFQYS